MIIKKFITCQTFEVNKQLEKNLAKYPNKKKNKNEAMDAPIPKKYL